MEYKRNEIVSNLYETSKSSKDGHLLSSEADRYEVYDLDQIKDEFCKYYRHDEKLKSCDAYYYDQHNQLVIEFKNTNYHNLKEYYNEIEIKIVDTHMMLTETFYRNKKSTELSKKLDMLLVYNDTLNYEEGVRRINNALNTMRPIKGNTERDVSITKTFSDEQEFMEAVGNTKKKYEGQFYKEIQFIGKKDFVTDYVEAGYFGNLTEWQGMKEAVE